MNAFLLFVGFLAGMVLLGWVVSKLTGSRAYFIEDWRLDEGEVVLWRDEAADTHVVTTYGRAKYNSYARPRRSAVLATDRRIIVGTRPLFGKKRMVLYVLYPNIATDGMSRSLGGGMLTRGYATVVFDPASAAAKTDGNKAYVELRPIAGEASSFNMDSLRIYTDDAEGLVRHVAARR